jgi:glycosyltransferase involved in cell wall biosynthesis
MRLSVALPCYNEEGNIEATVADVTRWLDDSVLQGQIVTVDDGSTDRTRAVLDQIARTDPRIRVVAHPLNLGYGAAVRTGLDAGTGDWLAFMDSDGQFRAADLTRLISETDQVDVVTGRRRVRADPWRRRFNARCFRAVNRVLFGVHVQDINCGMKMIRREVWPRIRPQITSGALFNLELFARMKALQIEWRQVDVDHYRRRTGSQTGARPVVVLRAAREMILLRLRL